MPETPVSRAFAKIVPILDDVSLDDERQEQIYNALATCWSETQRETREEVALRLDTLGDGRLEYVFPKLRTPKTGTDIELMGGSQGMIYGEATGAKWLAKIIRGETDKGWLPSWLWKS